MKFRVRSVEEIEKAGIRIKGSSGATFVPAMEAYCGKVFDFYEPNKNSYYYQGEKGWFTFVEAPTYTWHISWLKPLIENKQYLLDFK